MHKVTFGERRSAKGRRQRRRRSLKRAIMDWFRPWTWRRRRVRRAPWIRRKTYTVYLPDRP